MRKTKAGCLIILCLILLIGAGVFTAPLLKGFYREISFYWQERTEAEKTVMTFAKARGVSYGEYPESLIDLLERNPETEEFVLNYPFREDVVADVSVYDRDEGVPLFLQWDRRWGYERYGSDVIGITGCCPTCLAMAGYYVTGDASFSPDKVAAFAQRNGYYEKGYGSSWTLISEGGVKLGLDVTEIPLVKKRIVDNLEVNNPIILALGPGDFTSSGHYVVLVGIENGKFRVNDPNSVINSQKLWSYEELEGQIRNLWVIRDGHN
jgi:hypothetical protein